MKRQNITDCCKNAVGTMFLLAGAFFVCSTFLSMRAVFADPIAPTDTVSNAGPQTTRAGASSRTTRATSRNTASRATVARTATTVAPSAAGASRAVTSRNVVSRAGATGASRATASRNVVSRTGATNAVTSRATASRGVVARTAADGARVSLQGSAIRGSKTSATTNYTYLSSKLYTGNYSNIIDSTTGLISAEAYQNCLESYYTCMDEICTARNSAQRRCACAGRVKAFAEAETALETANEELIKVSGELALLIANKGKDVSDAFKLTDAEKVMNCVSWQDVTNQYGTNSEQAVQWCYNHGIYTSATSCAKPPYCTSGGNTFGFDVSNIDGTGSDILASLQSWANAKEQTLTIVQNDNDNLTNAFVNMSNSISQMAGIGGALADSANLKDSLAETWGYELFEYAHNNVCNRVLDSCFNGIYEACGTPPSSGRKCTNGSSQCPYNYNSMISVTNTGTYELNFVTGNSGYTSSNSATCFGYTSTSGDPYSNLRGPVADARRSILQKYALDANADCDAYGEQLRQTAQNIGYQKVAAQQALQQKRLEFAREEITTIASDYRAAISNFNECLSELYDCYTTQEQSNNTWSTSRIKTYCAQVSNVPHCYEEMVCGAPNNKLEAVITMDAGKDKVCNNSEEFAENTCRNVITLSEILNGSYASGALDGSSVQRREECLQSIAIEGVRQWTANRGEDTETAWPTKCNNGYHLENRVCVSDRQSCGSGDIHAKTAVKAWDSNDNSWGDCTITACVSGYQLVTDSTGGKKCEEVPCPSNQVRIGNECVSSVQDCTNTVEHAVKATKSYANNNWGDCIVDTCEAGYTKSSNDQKCEELQCPSGQVIIGNECKSRIQNCTSDVAHAVSANKSYTNNHWSDCIVMSCEAGYEISEDRTSCEQVPDSPAEQEAQE